MSSVRVDKDTYKKLRALSYITGDPMMDLIGKAFAEYLNSNPAKKKAVNDIILRAKIDRS